MPNRLARETSPYLLQHKDNPVDWYPWGTEALARARGENKPILLSIGYSACHWCHVMEHESFENPAIARLMNERFVCIKVDREERPDLDQIYQNVAQAMTRSGGWPLTVFLTPDLRPFFGGTYFPPEDRWGRPGFPRVVEALSDAFKNDPEGVAGNADRLTEFIGEVEKVQRASAGDKAPGWDGLVSACSKLLGEVDWQNGGFGGAPKFPSTTLLAFLWRMGGFLRDSKPGPQAREAVLLSLEKMASGGIYDQLGGGFHRYSVDESWSVPHFEKMLYDNGGLLKLYSEVLLSAHPETGAERTELFTRVVRETVEYVLREMRGPEGAFYAAQDADSEGEEGKFFVWDPKELAGCLSSDEARVFALRYGVDESGNFEHGKTVLYLAASVEEIAEQTGFGASRVTELVESSRSKLFAARSKRIAPATDTKRLASWNGLMISGLCFSSRALASADEGEVAKKALDAARGAFEFLSKELGRPEYRLWSTYKDGVARLNGYLDDYAFMAAAALDLARASPEGENAYLDCARGWIATVLKQFHDPNGAAYFFTSADHEALIHRPKTIYDQAIPSGTGTVLTCLAALSESVDDSSAFSKECESQLAGLFPLLERNPHGYGELLCASLLALKGPIAVSGPKADEAFLHPHVFRKPGQERQLCHRGVCGLPVEASELLKRVRESVHGE